MKEFWDWIWHLRTPAWIQVAALVSLFAVGLIASVSIALLCEYLNSLTPVWIIIAGMWFFIYREYTKSKENQ